MKSIIEDLTKLPPKRLARRLDELARDALPCMSVTVFDGSPEHGLTSVSGSNQKVAATSSTWHASSKASPVAMSSLRGRFSIRIGTTRSGGS